MAAKKTGAKKAVKKSAKKAGAGRKAPRPPSAQLNTAKAMLSVVAEKLERISARATVKEDTETVKAVGKTLKFVQSAIAG